MAKKILERLNQPLDVISFASGIIDGIMLGMLIGALIIILKTKGE